MAGQRFPCSTLLLTLVSVTVLNSASSQSFSRSQQSNNNVTLFGDAFFTSTTKGSFSLTQERTGCRSSSTATEFVPFHNNNGGVGRALYSQPVRLLDDSTNTTSSFSSTFTFSIVPSPLCSAGDGIAFLIASDAIPGDSNDLFTTAKGHIGLPRPGFSILDSFLALEFDTSFDPTLGDLNANHLGLDVNSAASVVSVDLVPRGIDLKSGRQITAWIDYRSPMTLVRVWLAYSPETRPPNPVLAAQIDLSGLFGEFVYVGFSASNGLGSSLHVINQWKFKTFPTQIPVDSFKEGDCFICSDSAATSVDGQNPITLGSRSLRDTILGIGGTVATLISALAMVGLASWVAIKNRNLAHGTGMEIGDFRRDLIRLSLAEISAATMGFDRSRIVGMGASATVYKGSLPLAGGDVAVKRFRRDETVDKYNYGEVLSCSSRNQPFTNEFATMVGCLRHKNLIQLRGWCCEQSETVLVYEYMPNGTLDRVLLRGTVALSWKQRLNIVLGVASALTFLHEECERQIIHRDVKSCNIMLDADLNAKLGDLGLAQVFDHRSNGRASRDTAALAGTMGYLAPEYVCSGVASVKTDVYSFGVVVLEVVTGRRAVEEGVGLADWVWGLRETGRLGAAVDPRVEESPTEREAERMLIVGLACVHPNDAERPTVKEAARMLRREVPLLALPAQKPRLRPQTAFFDEFGLVDDDPFLTPLSNFGTE